MPKPAYPEGMRSFGKDGMVRFVLAVDDKGNGRVSQIIEAPDPAFAEALKDAVKQWRFEPAKKDGRHVGFWSVIAVRFENR